MRPNESTPADFATAPEDSQQEDTSHHADKYDAKVMAQKIYNMHIGEFGSSAEQASPKPVRR